jgi:hypothetical protein
MLVESLRETARAIARSTDRKTVRVLVGRDVMNAVWLDARRDSVVFERSRCTSGLRVVRVAGLEIRERPWELTCEVRFEVEG